MLISSHSRLESMGAVFSSIFGPLVLSRESNLNHVRRNRFDLNFDDTSDHESREFAASLREHVETTVGGVAGLARKLADRHVACSSKLRHIARCGRLFLWGRCFAASWKFRCRNVEIQVSRSYSPIVSGGKHPAETKTKAFFLPS